MIGIYDINTSSNLNYKERLNIYKKCGFQEIALYLDSNYQYNNENYIEIINYAKEIGLQIRQAHIDWKISNLICDTDSDEYFDYVETKLKEAHHLDIKYVVAHASQTIFARSLPKRSFIRLPDSIMASAVASGISPDLSGGRFRIKVELRPTVSRYI